MKDAGEIDRIRRACAIADDAFQSLLPMLARRARPSASSRSRSSSRCASAVRAATASTRSSRRARTARSRTTCRATASSSATSSIVCDFGCIVEGYCSDMTRTVSVGDPGPDARHLYDVVLREPGRRAAPRSRSTSRVPRSTGRRATSSPRRAGPTRSRTRPGTASGSRSTRRRGSRRRPVIPCSSTTSSRSSRASTSPASAVCASRTPLVVGADRRRTPHPDPQGSRVVSISTNDLKNGMALNLPEGLVTVVEFQHVKPGKGGAFVRTKLKNVRNGAVLDRTFRADEKVKTRGHRQARDAVPLPRGHRLRLHGQRDLRPAPGAGRERRERGQLPEGGRHRGAAHLRGRGHRRRPARRRSSST